jgi:hypothetical protein
MPFLAPPIAAAGPMAAAITILGFFAVAAWIAWRFGPTLARVSGWGSLWVAWACGSQGGYGYCAAFLIFGMLAWGGGTLWWARRRGYWPSAVSAKLFGHAARRARGASPHRAARRRDRAASPSLSGPTVPS